MTSSASAFRAARDLLLQHRDDYDRAYAEFCWPELDGFNWALDWFDALGGEEIALWVIEDDGSELKLSFAELTERSNSVANYLRGLGVARGDRLILMLGNQVELWETLLAAMKLGAVVIPATTLLGPIDLADRVERGGARHVVTGVGDADKFAAIPATTRGLRWVARPQAGSGSRMPTPPIARSSRTGGRRRKTRSCSTSPPALRRSRSSSSTRTRRTRLGICRRCTGSASSRVTCI
jgi:hypothetical protein